MIKILDKNKFGCIIWGTKSGYKILDKYNINLKTEGNQDENTTALEKELADVRYVVDCNKQGALFYDLRLYDNSRSYTIYQIIYDGKDRPGFYAITICIDNNETIDGNTLQTLFEKLIQNFRLEYISREQVGYDVIKPDTSITSETILKDITKKISKIENKPNLTSDKGIYSYKLDGSLTQNAKENTQNSIKYMRSEDWRLLIDFFNKKQSNTISYLLPENFCLEENVKDSFPFIQEIKDINASRIIKISLIDDNTKKSIPGKIKLSYEGKTKTIDADKNEEIVLYNESSPIEYEIESIEGDYRKIEKSTINYTDIKTNGEHSISITKIPFVNFEITDAGNNILELNKDYNLKINGKEVSSTKVNLDELDDDKQIEISVTSDYGNETIFGSKSELFSAATKKIKLDKKIETKNLSIDLKDENGQVIHGAVVLCHTKEEEFTAIENKKGKYIIDKVHNSDVANPIQFSDIKITIQKEGYEIKNSYSINKTNEKIKLQSKKDYLKINVNNLRDYKGINLQYKININESTDTAKGSYKSRSSNKDYTDTNPQNNLIKLPVPYNYKAKRGDKIEIIIKNNEKYDLQEYNTIDIHKNEKTLRSVNGYNLNLRKETKVPWKPIILIGSLIIITGLTILKWETISGLFTPQPLPVTAPTNPETEKQENATGTSITQPNEEPIAEPHPIIENPIEETPPESTNEDNTATEENINTRNTTEPEEPEEEEEEEVTVQLTEEQIKNKIKGYISTQNFRGVNIADDIDPFIRKENVRNWNRELKDKIQLYRITASEVWSANNNTDQGQLNAIIKIAERYPCDKFINLYTPKQREYLKSLTIRHADNLPGQLKDCKILNLYNGCTLCEDSVSKILKN